MDGSGIAISWGGLGLVWTVATTAGGVIFAAFWWIYRRLVHHDSEMAGIRTDTEKRFGAVEAKVERVTDALDHLPDRESTHRLELSMETMRGEMRVIAEQLKPVSAISSRLQEMMMQERGGR